nr:MAG TPA: minor tail protein [Bacteriophage sp.]
MADVDIMSLSVEISAESQGAELNIDKLATAISNLRTKGNVSKVIDGLDKLTNSLTALKSAQGDFSGLEKVTSFIEGIAKVNASESAKSINTFAKSIQRIPDALSGMSDFSDALDSLRDVTDSFNSLSTIQAPKGLSSTINALKKIPDTMSGMDSVNSDLTQTKAVLASFNTLPAVTVPDGLTKIVNTLRRIPTVIAETNKADYKGLGDNIREIMNALAPLSLLDISGLKGLSSVFTALNKVPDLAEKLKAADLTSFKESCVQISSALTPLASQLDKVGNAFAKLPPQLSKVVTQANRVTATNEKQRKSYLSLSNQMNGFMRNMAKLVSLKAIAEYLGKAVAKFNDFYEATDLFHNAMGNLSGEADTLISKMQGLLGVDPTKAMTYMATIQSLGTSFGLTSDKAYILSKNLTQLAYDEGSYWNKDVAETFTAMSSAISGEIEPIRRLGVDLSQARLQQELLALGFNKQVSSLSQADKAVLRYIAIMKQTANVQGNLAQTIQSPANQIKILKAQLDMLAKSVGSLLYPALKSILPPLIAAVQLIREFVEWVAKLMGVKVVFTDFTKSADSVGGIGDAMDDTADSTKKAAKALKDYTIGFDELNIIDPTQGSSGSGSGASAGNILGDVDLSGYDMFKQYNEEFAKQIDAIKQKIKAMLPLIATVATALAAWKLTNLIMDIVDAIHKMNALKSIVLGLGVFTVGIVLEITGIKDAIENGVNGKNFAEIVLGALIGTTGAAILGKGIAQFIVTGFGNTAVGAAIKAAGGSTAGAIIGAAVGGVVTGIPMFVTGVYDAVKHGLNTLNGILIPLGSTMAGAGIGAIIGSLGGPIGTGIGVLIGLIVGGLTDAGIAIYQNWDKITESLDKASESLKNWFVGVGEWWNKKWQGFSTNFQTAWESLPGFVQHPIQALDQASVGLKQWFVGVGEWWNQKWAGFKKNWDRAWNSLVDTLKSLPKKFLDYGKNIVQGLIDGINNGIENAKKTVGGLAKAILDKFTTDTGIHSPSKVFEQFGIYIDQGLANGITAALPYVEQAMTNLANVAQQKGNDMIDYGADVANGFVDNMVNTFDAKWNEIDSGLKNDFIGTIKGMIDAVKKGDIQTVAENTAAIIWKAMGEENRNQVKSYASNLVSNFTNALKTVSTKVFSSAKIVSKNILAGITSKFGEISTQVVGLGSKIATSFSALIGPISASGRAISIGLSSGVLSQFPSIIAGIAGLIGQIGAAFMGILQTIGSVLTSLGIPTGVIMIAGGVAIAAAIAGIVGTLVGKYGTSSRPSVNDNYSSYPGTSDYDSANGSSTSVGSYYPSSSASGASPAELRSAVHDGCYNAFLDIFQRYGDELTGGKELKIYLDGKQITASVEKRQSERGFQIMGDEVYSY